MKLADLRWTSAPVSSSLWKERIYSSLRPGRFYGSDADPFPVLVVSSMEEDHAVFDVFIGGVGYTVHHASTLADAISILGKSQVAVVVTERTLPDGSWVGVLANCNLPFNSPLVIVFTDPVDATFWAQAFNLGAFDFLHPPLAEAIVARAVTLANLRWSRMVELSRRPVRKPSPSVGAAPLMHVPYPQRMDVSRTANGSRPGEQRASANT